jgi:hypothetical protein
MSVNEMNIALGRESLVISSRALGLLAMIGAPMLLLFFIFGNLDASAPKTLNERLMCLTGVMYMGGWICGAIGMRRLRATGDGAGAKIIYILQIALLICGLTFSVMEVAGYNLGNGGLIFAIADAGYPLSHLLMNVVGIFVLRAKVFSGLPRFAPFMVGVALPVTLGLMALGYGTAAGIFFSAMTTLGLGIIGYAVYKQSYRLIFNRLSSNNFQNMHEYV